MTLSRRDFLLGATAVVAGAALPMIVAPITAKAGTRVVSAKYLTDPHACMMFYEGGTTVPINTYTDENLSIANPNPVMANSEGFFPSIFIQDRDHRIVLKDAFGHTVWTRDMVRHLPT